MKNKRKGFGWISIHYHLKTGAINEPQPKKNKRGWYWNLCGTGESVYDIGQTKAEYPTQHINLPECPIGRLARKLGEDEE